MKYLTVLLLLLFLITTTEAQKDNALQTLFKSKYEHVYLSLDAKRITKKLNGTFPFRNIEVVDYRPDSSRIGLFLFSAQQYNMLFKSPASGVISAFMNEGYANLLATDTLFVIIKKLWFSDGILGKQPGEKPKSLFSEVVHVAEGKYGKQSDNSTLPFKSRICFRAETYIKNNTGYIPLAIFDTVITSRKAIMDIAYFRLQAVMIAFMEKINASGIDPAAIKKRRVLSFTAVNAFSCSSLLFPMDTASVLQKGVYASFEEFRNNRPSVLDYVIEQDENSLMTLHLKDEQGEMFNSRKMWGFCDGQQTYVMMEGNLFPVITHKHGYYVYGSKEYLVRKTSVPLLLLFPASFLVGTVPISEKVTRKLRFFRLDMESGEIY